MNLKLLLLICTAIGLAPVVVWALVSIVTLSFSIFFRPVTFSFRLYSEAGARLGVFEYHELPLLTSLLIVVGATLLILGVVSIQSPR